MFVYSPCPWSHVKKAGLFPRWTNVSKNPRKKLPRGRQTIFLLFHSFLLLNKKKFRKEILHFFFLQLSWEDDGWDIVALRRWFFRGMTFSALALQPLLSWFHNENIISNGIFTACNLLLDSGVFLTWWDLWEIGETNTSVNEVKKGG